LAVVPEAGKGVSNAVSEGVSGSEKAVLEGTQIGINDGAGGK
jgi:hypothetical protein